MVSRGWELDDVGYIHRGQCCYVDWCVGKVRSELLKWRLSTSSAVFAQYVEICLITYRFSVKIGSVYEVLCAIKLVLYYPMESFYIAVVCWTTRRYETMFYFITRKRLLKSAPSCASGRHHKLRPIVRLHRYQSQIYPELPKMQQNIFHKV